MNITFVTTNRHKFEEVQEILREFPVELVQLDLEYEENHNYSLEANARDSAKKLARELGRTVITEDTGLFFEAYVNFPGALSKFIYQTLGYKGIFKLLEDETRGAYFQTVAALCDPAAEPVLFQDVLKGSIATEVHDQVREVMQYDRIFIPEGMKKTISLLTLEEKNLISQRGKAFRKLGAYVAEHPPTA